MIKNNFCIVFFIKSFLQKNIAKIIFSIII